MATIILLNKPYQVLCQFRDEQGRKTLLDYLPDRPGYYPAGRLDYDSEGLVALTDDGKLQNRISDPRFKLEKTYWVQVEGVPAEGNLQAMRDGLTLKDGPTRPAGVRRLESDFQPWARVPPIRQRENIPTTWLEIRISEGRNRQVRRMTAAIGYPTLRLIRFAIGDWSLENLAPGDCRIESVHLPKSQDKHRSRRSPGRHPRKPHAPARNR